MKKAYRVVIDDKGCQRCKEGKTWTLVDLNNDGILMGKSWIYKEDAKDQARALNYAFKLGCKVTKKRRK